MNKIVEIFKTEFSEDFNDLSLIPESIIEKSADELEKFVLMKRELGEKIFINVYNDNGEEHIELTDSEKKVDILNVYEANAIYELVFEYRG